MDIVRSAFTQKKRRFIEDGFNLDLSYITPRIIAMGYPASGLGKLYRNSIDEVARFLEGRHGSYYKVFNLCEAPYDNSKFDNRVLHLPWPDHHAPPLGLLFQGCLEIHRWLLGNPKSIVVVNCLAGKGRTGTLICSYLLFCGRLSDPQDALDYYKVKRFRRLTEETGVTQPSQMRYIHYFSEVLQGRVSGPQVKQLKSVYISQGQSEFTPVVKVSVNRQVIYINQASSRAHHERSVTIDEHARISVRVERLIYGDVLCQFMHWGRLGLKEVCRMSFHTSFHPHSQISFAIEDLDPFSYRNMKEYKTGSITLEFEPMTCCSNSDCPSCKRTLDTELAVWNDIHTVLGFRSELMVTASQQLFTDSSPDDIDEAIQTYRL